MATPARDLRPESLIADIGAAARSGSGGAVREILAGIVADPAAVAAAMPPFDGDQVAVHESDDLSIYWVRFFPGELIPPHDHRVPAFIGVFSGVEVNRLHCRKPGGGIEQVRERRIGPGETLSIGGDGIHSVFAGNGEESLALHVYLGNLDAIDRSLFHPETDEEMPFTEANYRALLRPAPE